MNLRQELPLWPKAAYCQLALEIGLDILDHAANPEEATHEEMGRLRDAYELHRRTVEQEHAHFADLVHAGRLLALADAASNVYDKARNRELLCWPYPEAEDPHSYRKAYELGLRMLHPSDQAKTGSKPRSAVHGGHEETRASA